MRLLIPALVALITLAGCDSVEEPVPTLLLPEDAAYAWSVESRFVEGDSLVFDTSADVRIRTVSRNASVPGYRGLTEIEASVGGGSSRTWYEPTEERLRDVAYASAGATPVVEPRSRSAVGNVYGLPHLVAELTGRHDVGRGVSEDDSITVRADPRVVYELPLSVGASWVSFTDPFESTREVIGRETVALPVGSFDVFVIRTEIGWAGPEGAFEWFDYVSEEHGLVLRTVESTHEYRGPNNEPLGLVRSVERMELTGGS